MIKNLFVLFYLISLIVCQNKNPVILIHGFLGWGREEMNQYYYWGGRLDYETMLRKEGYNVFTVSVGPISTNWDRAIEAFYQIKGGQVDYGIKKSQELNIIQKPINKNYSGLYPQWDQNNPIHIIAHSQGGQTARMLEYLLNESFKEENSKLLTNKLNGWIQSITTIATPHNGSTLVPIMLDLFPFSLNLAPWFGSINNNVIDNLYNFDLEHWSLNKHPNESLKTFINRLSKSKLSKSKNLCSWDLSLEGAKEFNKIYYESNDVYYFSFITSATNLNPNTLYHKPSSQLSYHLWPTAILMGKYNQALDNSWYENDGIVNSVSMSHPFGSSVIPLSKNPIKGIWQVKDTLNIDHQAIIGHGITLKENSNIFVLYKKHCELLYKLK